MTGSVAKPYYITFSGIDDSVSDRELRESLAFLKDQDLLEKLELGVLYMPEKAGKDRYPTVDWIRKFSDTMHQYDVRLSLHLCGIAAFRSLFRDDDASEFFTDMDWFDRFQLNVNAREDTFSSSELHELYGVFWDSQKTYILQCHERNRDNIHSHLYSLAKVDPAALKRVQVLYDASKGTGTTPREWPRFQDDNLVDYQSHDLSVMRGYAGGLGPDNIRSELDRIVQSRCYGEKLEIIYPYEYWVDMETNIRSKTLFSSRFDFTKVIDTLTKVYR